MGGEGAPAEVKRSPTTRRRSREMDRVMMLDIADLVSLQVFGVTLYSYFLVYSIFLSSCDFTLRHPVGYPLSYMEALNPVSIWSLQLFVCACVLV